MVYTFGMAKSAKISAKSSTANSKVAKLFRNGRSQAVRLPKDFRFEGDRVRVRRIKEGVLLEPMVTDVRKWFANILPAGQAGAQAAESGSARCPRRLFDQRKTRSVDSSQRV